MPKSEENGAGIKLLIDISGYGIELCPVYSIQAFLHPNTTSVRTACRRGWEEYHTVQLLQSMKF